MEWHRADDARVLVVANGSFLLNAALVNRARRPLASQVVRWAGEEPMHVAFVEGSFVLGDPPAQPSVFSLLDIPPFGWLAAQLLALGLAVCLARAPSLGRPRPDPPSGEDRPVAHPEALGALWERTGAADDARSALRTYRLGTLATTPRPGRGPESPTPPGDLTDDSGGRDPEPPPLESSPPRMNDFDGPRTPETHAPIEIPPMASIGGPARWPTGRDA